MKTTCSQAAVLLAMIGLGGCSGSDEGPVSELPAGKTLSAASINLPPTATPGSAAAITSSTATGSNGATSDAVNRVEPFRNPFAPPKSPPPPPIVEEPDPEPEPATTQEPTYEVRKPGVPPKIRLLGFMNIGEPKALISYHDELETLAIGDTLEDMQVIKIESPSLTMLFEEREIKLSLFDQTWRHEGGPTSTGNNNGGVLARPRSTRPPRDTRNPTSGSATAIDTSREPTGFPPLAPNAGKPPAFQPPAGSTPGTLIGSPPPRLPGLSSEASGGTGTGDSGLPGFPGLGADSDGNSGAAELPALPGGP